MWISKTRDVIACRHDYFFAPLRNSYREDGRCHQGGLNDGARGVSVAVLSWAASKVFVCAAKLGCGAGPLGEFVGVVVAPSESESEEECDSEEDADGENDEDADELLGALEELPEESELNRVFVRRVAISAHSEQNSLGCDVT